MGTVSWILAHWKTFVKAILGLAVGVLIGWSVMLHKQNKKLSESLEMARNNIEAYQGVINGSQQANNVLQLDINELQTYNDELLHQLDSVREDLKIKDKQLKTAATQTQIINVSASKGVGGDLTEILKDTIYTDSIKYNPLTTVKYTIGKDTVSIGLDVRNTQYLFMYTTKEYKNKKSFLKRLITFDWKKVEKHKYEIENTNDVIKTDDVRIVEIKQ